MFVRRQETVLTMLETLRHLTETPGPFASVCLDVTRVDRASEDSLSLRWAGLARNLEEMRAPAAMVEALGAAVAAPTEQGGECSRVLVASGDGLVLDVVLPGRQPEDEAFFGVVPQLTPLVRALSSSVPHVIARVNRSGADIEVVGLLGRVEDEQEVEGGHDELRRVAPGGSSQRRFQTRAQDSWERNATVVAEELARLVRRYRPELVLVEGDENTVAQLIRHAPHEVAALLVHLRSGGRAAGVGEEAEHDAVLRALEERRAARRADLLARLAERVGRRDEGLEGLEPVLEVLRRGQVAELVLLASGPSPRTLWAGEQPLALGSSREDALAAGAGAPEKVPLDAALVWAALGCGAQVHVLDSDDPFQPAQGVAAILRWSDPSTPH